MKKCPYCAEEIQDEAIVCRFCSRDLRVSPAQAPPVTATQKAPSSGASTLATIAVVCGVIGLIAFGIPLGIVAVLCGIAAVSMGQRRGATGIVLGIIDIVAAVFLLSLCSLAS